MKPMTSISTGKAKGGRRGAGPKLDLANAYVHVFRLGTATQDQRDVVLTDLADFCGYYKVQGPGSDPDTRAFNEGMRSAFGRIMSHLRMTPDERDALERAARHEGFVNQSEGEI